MKVDFKHSDYLENIDYVTKVEDCYIGTKVISKKIGVYLEKNFNESQSDYNIRSGLAKYLNYVGKTIDSVNGMLFRKDLKMNYKVKYGEYLKNVDGEGTPVKSFLSKHTANAIIGGFSLIWVDGPAYGNKKVSKADLLKTGNLPVWKNIKRSDLINWDSEINKSTGERVFTFAVIKQVVSKKINYFETKLVTQFVVLNKYGGKIYEGENENFKVVNEWTNKLGYVPLFVTYSKKDGFMKADIPFLDLANMNLSLFSEIADDASIKKKTRSPILTTFGFQQELDDDGNKIENKFGLNDGVGFSIKTEEGMSYVSPDAEVMKISALDLKEAKKDLETFSLNIFSKFSYNTATEALLNDKDSSTFLDEIALSLDITLENVLSCVNDYIGIDLGIDIKVNKDFNSSKISAEAVDKLISLKNNGIISHDTVLDRLVKGEFIDIDSIDEEKKRVKSEKDSLDLIGGGV